MKKRFLSFILAIVVMVALFPISAFASENWWYTFKIQTKNISGAGTGATARLGFHFYDLGRAEPTYVSGEGDMFEKGSLDTCEVNSNQGDPWMITKAYVGNDGSGTASSWLAGNVEITVPYVVGTTFTTIPFPGITIKIPNERRYIGSIDVGDRWIDNSEETRDCSALTKRTIKNLGQFDSWGGNEYIGGDSTGRITRNWDCKIDDNYCVNGATYNPFKMGDPPTITALSSNSNINAFTLDDKGDDGNVSFSIDKKALNNQMMANNLGEVTFTITTTFPSRSTTNSVHTEYLTVYRKCFELGRSSIANSITYSPIRDYNFFNKDNVNVKIEIEPTTIYLKNVNSPQKNTLAKNFYARSALYVNRVGGEKICDLSYTSSNGKIYFTGIVPKNYSTRTDGVKLVLDNVSSVYELSEFTLNQGSHIEFPFSTHKVDTSSPSVSILDENSRPLKIDQLLKQTHKFYMTANETVYPKEFHGGVDASKFRYSLYKFNGESYATKAQITNFDGTGSYSQVTAPINSTILKDIPINLKLAQKEEGKYQLQVSAYDLANNAVSSDSAIISNIYIDNQAPRVDVVETIQNQAVDGTKRNDYRFDMTDIAATSGLSGAWARTYYCFVKKGETMPEPNKDQISSGEIDSVVGKWAFVEGGLNAGTAIFKVAKDADFEGTLYYFTQDSAGNDSHAETNTYFKKNVKIMNYDAKDTLVTETSDFPKSSYEISFKDDENLKTQYHWIAKDPGSTFRQSYQNYTNGAKVGAASQPVDGGGNVSLDGIYTLEYKVTEQRSGNYQIFTKDYSFDNAPPKANISWATKNLSLLPEQQINVRITDISGVKAGKYQIVNPDNSAVEGASETDFNITASSENIAEVRETITFKPDKSGVYGLKISATDRNNIALDMKPSDIGLFAIRGEKPEITSYNHDLTKKVGDIGVTDGDYNLNITVAEKMLNAKSLTKEQVVKYCISTDGTNYGPWTVADEKLNIGTSELTQSFTLRRPTVLHEGNNNIYIKTACMNSGDDTAPSIQLVSDPKVITIKCDATAPVYDEIIYNTTQPTKADVIGTIKVSDAGTGTTNLTCSDPNVKISKENNGIFTITIAENVETSATLSDLLGNSIEVPIKVTNIDKNAPVITGSSVEVLSGERKDSKITVVVTDKNPSIIQFALVSDGVLNSASFEEFQKASTFQTTHTESVKNAEGLYETVYTIFARGKTGSFELGAKAVDSLGNTNESIITNTAFTIVDVAAAIKSIECDPTITKTTSTVTVTFTTKVAVQKSNKNVAEELMLNSAMQEYSLTYSTVCDSAEPFDIIVSDECGRESTLTVTPTAKFIEGYKTKQTLNKNGEPIKNGEFISFEQADTIQLIIEVSDEYQEQKLLVNELKADGFILNEAESIKSLTDETAYTKLCFNAQHNGKTVKTISFNSYTFEGLEADRLQAEYIAISTIDETPPEYQIKYNTTEPTNNDVLVNVDFSDAQSGITKVEQKSTETYNVLESNRGFNLTLSENETLTYRITNGAGMQTQFDVSVSNIDKTPIEKEVHYTVEYRFQNYLGEWVPIVDKNSYRSVMAVIVPLTDSNKILSATNHSGLSKILTREENSFTFAIKDKAGNTCEQEVRYENYDNKVGTTTWKLSNMEKTNLNVTAFVNISDEQNEIAFAQVKNSDGKVYQWKGEPVGNEYAVELDSSGIYTISAFDMAGNSWSTDVTVSNIDKTPPVIKSLLYSTPKDTVTSRNVRVDISEFSKPNVKVTGIELGDGLTDSDVVYTQGSTSVRFKKNGYISIFFQDDYGNKGQDVINVKNIYDKPPQLKAVANLAEDSLSMSVKFEKETDENGLPLDIYRDLNDVFVAYNGITYNAGAAEFKLKNNGDYNFSVFDAAGATQYIKLQVSGIDDIAPKITQVSWSYEYKEENEQGIWERKNAQKTLVIGKDTSGTEAGYAVSEDKYQVTNGDVTVIVTTDKNTTPVGSTNKPNTNTSMVYQKNGMYIFNQKANNGTSASYAVDVGIIDKTPPVIELKNGNELIFIEGMTPAKDPRYAYDIQKLLDYSAYDVKAGKNDDLTSKVKIDYGKFNPNDITKNVFDRSNPYYIEYTVYDSAGNCTVLRRTIRLVGFYDTIALVNGVMPDSTNTATAVGDKVEISLKNFNGISYARYEEGIHTMGQMKTIGKTLVERNGAYTITGLQEGWYTVYLQTDKRDYFNIKIYYKPNVN